MVTAIVPAIRVMTWTVLSTWNRFHHLDIHFLWRPYLRDPDDDTVLELAVAARCPYIVTHNVNDFRKAADFGVTPITPRYFLELLRSAS